MWRITLSLFQNYSLLHWLKSYDVNLILKKYLVCIMESFCGFTVGRKPDDLEKVHLLHLVTTKYLTCRHQGSNLGHTWISDSLSEQVACLGLNPQAKILFSVSTIEYLQFNKSEMGLASACFGIYLTTKNRQPLNVTHKYFLLVQNSLSLRMYSLTYFQSIYLVY